jgi:predicted O-linked N-acetylglucosamine transferase (SPINDLY family)
MAGIPKHSGIPTIDYRITDSIGEPQGVDPTLFAERLARLDPLLLCYTPLGEPPALVPSPFDQSDNPQSGVVFANFGSVARYNLPTLERWCRVLRAVPGSRLLLKGYQFRDESFRSGLAERLVAAGAEPDSLILEPPAQGSAELLKHYARVDITLDSFPYTGTTTTCESLLMGVPVVTMTGSTSPSRVAPSILSAVDLRDLIARSDDAFVSIATTLAADRDRLRSMRSPGPDGLRASFLRSPAGDAAAFAHRMEQLLRDLWRQWCASRWPK